MANTDQMAALMLIALCVVDDLGLLPEEDDVDRHRRAGSLAQSPAYLAIVNSALGSIGPVLQRGGG